MNAQQVRELLEECMYPVDCGHGNLNAFLDREDLCSGDYWDGNYHEGIEVAYQTVVQGEDGPYDCYTIRWLEVEYVGDGHFNVVAWDDRFWGGDWIGATSIGGVATLEDYELLCCPFSAEQINNTQGIFSSQTHEENQND